MRVLVVNVCLSMFTMCVCVCVVAVVVQSITLEKIKCTNARILKLDKSFISKEKEVDSLYLHHFLFHIYYLSQASQT